MAFAMMADFCLNELSWRSLTLVSYRIRSKKISIGWMSLPSCHSSDSGPMAHDVVSKKKKDIKACCGEWSLSEVARQNEWL